MVRAQVRLADEYDTAQERGEDVVSEAEGSAISNISYLYSSSFLQKNSTF
jgi:hypothetical protein